MKKFKKNILIFITFFLVLFLFFEVSTLSYISSKADFKLESNPNYIILGHSHPETAYNDSLIHNFSNLAQSGESYFYTYQKAKEIFKQNKSLETVFIEFTNNQINEDMNFWIWGDKYITNRYPIYASFMNRMDNQFLMNKNLKGYYNAFALSSKNKFLRLLKNDLSYVDEIGGYLYLDRNKTDSILKTSRHILEIKEIAQSNFKISKYNILYLKKLIALSHKYNLRVILIRSPMHTMSSGYFNEEFYKKLISQNFKNVEYLDLSKFPGTDNEFGDLEHLNYQGARKFSIWFNQLIKNGTLEKTIDQKIINKILDNYI